MDQQQIDSILSEHDWASDHISVATENLEHVFNFLSGMGESENEGEFESDEEDNQIEDSKEDNQIGEDMPDEIKGFKDFE
jgi:hypothetical protein